MIQFQKEVNLWLQLNIADSEKLSSIISLQQKEHPPADTVYLHVKEDFPNISLGTVYRNLNLLTDIGEAIKIPTPDGGDRFDGNVIPHNHFLCTSCGRLLDLELDMKSIEEVNRLAGENFDGIITSSSTLFYGECSDCIRKS